MWEKAIEMSKQLAKMHENQMFDFMELSQLLVRMHVFHLLWRCCPGMGWTAGMRYAGVAPLFVSV